MFDISNTFCPCWLSPLVTAGLQPGLSFSVSGGSPAVSSCHRRLAARVALLRLRGLSPLSFSFPGQGCDDSARPPSHGLSADSGPSAEAARSPPEDTHPLRSGLTPASLLQPRPTTGALCAGSLYVRSAGRRRPITPDHPRHQRLQGCHDPPRSPDPHSSPPPPDPGW